MPYLIDRRRALPAGEIVAILSVRRRGVRSLVVLEDNSLYESLTRPRAMRRRATQPIAAQLVARRRATRGRSQGVG